MTSGSSYRRIDLNAPDRIFSSSMVEPGGLDLDEHVVLPDHRLGDIRFLQRPLVLADDKRSHGDFLLGLMLFCWLALLTDECRGGN